MRIPQVIVKMVSLPTVNLPILMIFHSLFMSFLALRMIYRRSTKPTREDEVSAIGGIATLAIGVAYPVTSYMPISENQFLHASVPVRIFLALVAGSRLLLFDNMSKDGRNEMLFVILYDGIGAIICGWQLGNFSGVAPAWST